MSLYRRMLTTSNIYAIKAAREDDYEALAAEVRRLMDLVDEQAVQIAKLRGELQKPQEGKS